MSVSTQLFRMILDIILDIILGRVIFLLSEIFAQCGGLEFIARFRSFPSRSVTEGPCPNTQQEEKQ